MLCCLSLCVLFFFFFNDTATTEIYTLSLHDALPISLVEISVIIAAAYICFFIAEHFLHVSGVLALVTFGLVMAGSGKTKISPEVHHFLHEFWELAAFIANTLIFIIVGVVIAQRTIFSANDFLIDRKSVV